MKEVIEMKTRNGFVSNSSTSSFVIAKSYMTPQQIKEFIKILENNEMDETSIQETKSYFVGEISQHDETIISWLQQQKLYQYVEGDY